MSREIATAAAILVVLAGCRDQPGAEAPVETVNATNETPPLPDADINASLGLLGEDPEMPDQQESGTDRFIGRWAVHEDLCANAAWTFTADEMRTPTGVVCRFTDISGAAGGYDIAASCTAEGRARDDTLQLRFAESAGALLFDARHIADTGLIRCEG